MDNTAAAEILEAIAASALQMAVCCAGRPQIQHPTRRPARLMARLMPRQQSDLR